MAADSAPQLSNNHFENNVTDGDFQRGGALYDAGGATLTGNQFVANHADQGGAVYVAASALSTALHFNEVYSNTAHNLGGALFLEQDAEDLLLEGNVFAHNSAVTAAAVYAEEGSALQAISNLFYDNEAGSHGGALWSAGVVTLWNNTLADNRAATAGGAIYINGPLTASNNIIAGNSADSHAAIDVGPNGSATGSYNNVYANDLGEGVDFAETRDHEPGFANPENENYHLLASSANIDAGDPATPSFVSLDMDGEARPNGDGVDIGADEYHPGVPAFTLTPDSQTLYGERGTEVTLAHTLSNNGTAGDTYTFVCNIDVAGWMVTVCPAPVTLPEGQTAIVETRVAIPAGAAPPQQARVELQATSEADDSLRARALVTLRVAPHPALLFTPNYSATVESGRQITFTHTLTNTGDDVDSFVVSLSSDSHGWAQLLPADPYTTTALLPGSSTQVRVVVSVPQYAPAGLADIVVVTAASAFDPTVSASVEDTVTARATVGTRYVSPTGTDVDNNCTVPTTAGGAPGPCRTVGHAVGQASLGDEIRVAQGAYPESGIAINNSLRLSGGWSANFAEQSGPETTVIDAGGSARIFTVAPGPSVSPSLSNLTLTGGSAAGPGGAISVGAGARLRLEKVIFAGNESGNDGGALYAASGSVVTILQSAFRQNSAAANGGALAGQGTWVAYNNLFAGNSAGGHGGAWYAAGGTATSGNNTLVDNQAGSNGGAFYNDGATLVVENNLFASNGATGQGGAAYGQSGSSTVQYSLLWENTEPAFAGLVGQSEIRTGDPLLTGPDFRLQRGSAAVDAGGPSPLTADFEGDFRPSDQGYDIGWDELIGCRTQRDGVVYGSIQDALNAGGSPLIRVHGICRGVHPLVVGGRTVYQTVHLVGENVHIQGGWNGNFTRRTLEPTIVDPEGRGRAFYVSGTGSPILDYLTIQNGDAAGLGGAANGDDAGGAVYNLDSSLIITNSVILSSTAQAGGAVYNQSGAPLLNGLHLHDNAADSGGAVYNATGALRMTNTILERNEATSGGAFYNASGVAAVWHNTFYANAATSNGGALFSQGNTPVVRNNIFLDNEAPAGSAVAAGGGAPDEDYNYYYPYDGGTLENVPPGPHSVIDNVPPGLEDPAGGNFRLVEGAPAVDAGDPNSPVTRDFENDRRPSDQGFDMGADELAGCFAQVNGVIYGSLQAALDAAPDGATVRVAGRCTGVHSVNTADYGGNAAICGGAINVTAHLVGEVTLQGGWDMDFRARNSVTILDARQGGRILYIAPGSNVTVEGFDMRNGRATGTGGAAHGGAICADDATATIRENRIYDNEAANRGGALYAGRASLVQFSSNQVMSNTAASGGGVNLNTTLQSALQNNFFVANTATANGGAYYNTAGSHRFWHNTVVNNDAGDDGGALYVNTGRPNVRNNIVVGNDAGGAGGGIYANTEAALSYNDFYQNTAAVAGTGDFGGGGISDGGPGALSVDPQFVSRDGLDYLLDYGSPVVDRGDETVPLLFDFEEDIRPSHQGPDMGADGVGGCFASILDDSSETIYGSLQRAVDVAPDGATVQFSGACRGANSRSVGGVESRQGLFLDKSLTIDGQWDYAGMGPGEILPLARGRGVTTVGGADVTLDGVTVRGGDAAAAGYAAGNGGGIYNQGTLHLQGESEIAGSVATNGGGLYNAGAATVTGSRLSGNSAGSGGAVYQAAGTLWLDGNRLNDNVATNGGALFLAAATDLRVWNNFIYRNRATNGGGITYAAGSGGALLHNTLFNNSATGGQGGGIYVAGGSVQIFNNIVDRHSGSGIHVVSGASATIDYNNVAGNVPSNYSGAARAGAHDISQLPLYVAAAEDDYHLQAASAGVDVGTETVVDHDVDGDIRPTNHAADMGADELALCLIRVGDRRFGVLQEAIDYAEANGLHRLEVARGECRGVQERNGTWQVGYVSGDLEMIGSLLPESFADPNDYNSEVGANSTVFDAEGQGRVLYVAPGAELTVKHVVFANGNAAEAGGANHGGAIYNAGTVMLDEANICQSTADLGGGYYAAPGSTNEFIGGYSGRCIAADFYSAAPDYNLRSFLGNTATTGGGYYVAAGAGLEVRNHGWIANSASGDGGGLYNAGATARIVNGIFFANSSETGDGAGLYNQGSLRLYHNTFNGNEAPGGGGGAIYSSGSLTLNSTIVYANSASGDGGVFATGTPDQSHNLFFANSPNNANFTPASGTLFEDPLLWGWHSLDVRSPAIDQADPANWQTGVPPDGLEIDFDANNERRPDGNDYGPYPEEAPSLYASDIGADEWDKDFGCRVTFSPPGRTAQAGETVIYTVAITNTGRLAGEVWHYYTDTLTVTLEGSSQGWAELEGGPEQSFTLGGREAVHRVVTVTVPADATTAQQEQTTIRCTSVSHPAATATGSAITRVGLDGGVLVEPDHDASARPGEVLTFTHRVTNVGNQTDDFALTANSGPRHATAALVTEAGAIYTPTVTLAPGETYTVLLRVRVLETATATDTAQPGVVARSTSDPTIQGAALNTIVIEYTSGTRYVAGAGALDDTNCTDPQNPCATIDHAIAQATDGDAILVAAGSYTPVAIDKSVTIQGGYSTVDGFTVAQPITRAVTLTGGDPLVTVGSGVTVTLSSLFIRDGGGVGIASSGALTISGTWILDNAGSGLVHDGDALTVINSVFAGNGGEGNGGAIAAAGGGVTLLNNTFAGNSAGGNGGALYQENGSLALYNNIFSANSAVEGSAVYLEAGVSAENDHNLFHDQTNVNLPDGPNDAAGDPLLTVPFYHLGAGSPAIDQGSAGRAPAVDFELERRPQGIAFDIGADEYTQRAEFVFLPEAQSAIVDPGGTITFTHTLTNTGDFADTYSLEVENLAVPSSSGWTVQIDPAGPFSVPPGDSQEVTVTVVAPEEPGYRHTTTITATSLAAGSAAVQDLVIVAFEAGVEIGPSRQGSGLPGSAITYTHTITNLGNGYDRFTLTVAESLPPSWTVTLSPDEIGLEAGASAAFTVTVGIPAGAAPGDTHAAHIAAHSTADLAISDDLTDTTTVGTTPQPEYGLLLLPASQAQTVSPGETAVYTHTLTNNGNVADTVDLSADTDMGWTTTVLPQQVNLAAGESASVVVEVQAPAGAAGLSATTTVTALSGGDSSVTATASDVTTVQAPPAEYAVVISPGTSRTGRPGETVTFRHTITNLGTVADSFVVDAVVDPAWALSWPVDPLALEPGASTEVAIGVTIPSGAAGGMAATITVAVQSQGDLDVSAQAVNSLTVVVDPQTEWRLYLPVVGLAGTSPPPPPPPTPTPTVGPGPTPTATPTPTPSPTPCTPTGIDLVVTDIAVQPAAPSAGEQAMVYVTIRNQGSRDVALGNNFYLDFYVDREPAYLLPGDVIWGVQGSWMKAGASRTFTAGYAFTAGSHRLYALVDTDNSVDECPHEANNRFGPVTLNASPSALSPGGPASAGEPTPAPTMVAPRSTPTPQPPEQEQPEG